MTGQAAKFSNYSGGFSGGLTLRDLPVSMTHAGKVFWVGSAGAQNTLPTRKTPSDGNKGTFLAPYATIDKANGACVADRGDIIMVLPGHTETLSAAIALDVAGVSVIGLGNEGSRPRLTGGVAADLVAVTADDVRVANLYFNEKTTASATNSTIDVAAAGCTIEGCRFDIGANEVLNITVTAAGEELTVKGNVFNVTANGLANAVQLEGVVDRPLFEGNIFVSSVANGPDDGYWVSFEAQAVTNPIFSGNTVVQSGDAVYGNSASVVGLQDLDAARAGQIQVTLCPATADDDEIVIADVTGIVNVWAVLGFTETALTAAVSMGVEADGNGVDLIATTAEGGDENGVAGDVLYATSPGGAVVEAEAGTAIAQIDFLWSGPLQVTTGEIVGANTGTPSTGILDYVIYWTPVSDDGNVADE